MRIAFIEFLETVLSHSLRVYKCCSVNWNDDARYWAEAVILAFVTSKLVLNVFFLLSSGGPLEYFYGKYLLWVRKRHFIFKKKILYR